MQTKEEELEYMTEYILQKWRGIIGAYKSNEQQFSNLPQQGTSFPTGVVLPVSEAMDIVEYLLLEQQTQFTSDFSFLTEDQQYELVKDYPSLISLIENPSTELLLLNT